MSQELISVIIPAYNAARYLAQTRASVLAQDYRPIEVVIVDDGSTDGTEELVRGWPDVRYVRQANQGPPGARNTGLAHSTGQLLAFLDADDLWVPGKLTLQYRYLQEHPEEGGVIARWNNFIEETVKRPDWVTDAMFSEELMVLSLEASLLRREVFDRVGGFNPQYRVSDDLEWFVRVREAGIRIGVMDAVLARRRIHDANISADQSAIASATVRIMKEHLNRTRGAAVTGRGAEG
jgi:glycosyltransferase involved in cell wall biosynthesis